ncbi:helix-turn-helix domain-containing protein [Gordonia amicalis]|uniref:IclR family transcriptional regulator n=1 Tax=Gordonia amicalis TaxID=89053 RepID=UPI0022A6BD02|nr:helix-turn-helix domain-containing protein [Gordonia amicalis]MCZ0914151.1 helix-turn-helix domain-containing protein [Gordonia amicalis]
MTTSIGQAPSVLGRALLLLEPFRHRDGLTLTELAERTGFPRSTTHRMLTQLVAVGWIRREGTTYLLGPKMAELGSIAQVHDRVHQAAQPVAYQLYRRTRGAVHVAVAAGEDVLFLEKIGGRWAAANLDTRVGQRRGRDETVEGAVLSRHEAGGPTQFHDNQRTLASGEHIRCLAATFDVPGQAATGGPTGGVAVISLTFPTARMHPGADEELRRGVRAVVHSLS